MSIISIQNLSKSFNVDKKSINVLDKISLEIEKGDIFGVIGLSGEGKSTLVRCINLLEKPDNGEINYSIYDEEENLLEIKNLIKYTLRGEDVYINVENSFGVKRINVRVIEYIEALDNDVFVVFGKERVSIENGMTITNMIPA